MGENQFKQKFRNLKSNRVFRTELVQETC